MGPAARASWLAHRLASRAYRERGDLLVGATSAAAENPAWRAPKSKRGRRQWQLQERARAAKAAASRAAAR